MSIKDDIKMLSEINIVIAASQEIVDFEKHAKENDSFLVVLEYLKIYSAILEAKPFVGTIKNNKLSSEKNNWEIKVKKAIMEQDSLTLNEVKSEVVEKYHDLIGEIQTKYKKSSGVQNKFGYDKRKPLLEQVIDKIVTNKKQEGYLKEQKPLVFNTQRISQMREQFSLDGSVVKHKMV